MSLAWAFLTDTGVRRESNEDSALGLVLNIDTLGERNTLGLFVVSDGMGGKEKGELASKIAIKTLGEGFAHTFLKSSLTKVSEIVNYGERTLPSEEELLISPAKFLVESIKEANRKISSLKKGGNRVNLGATVTAGILTDELLTLGHVGDCRCYLYFKGTLRQLTKDHSMVNELIRKGVLSPDEAKNHPQRNVLSRALGSTDEVEVDTGASVLERGCKLMFCTDGLYTMLPDTDIMNTLARDDHPTEITGALVNAANAAGGKDNVTVMVIHLR